MKRKYERMSMVPLMISPEEYLLAASVMPVPMEVSKVEVEDYTQGFGTDATNDYQEVSFD